MNARLKRIVDANINRVTEGLRVVEDICRYAWNDQRLSLGARDIRHRACRALKREDYIPFRDTQGDVLAPGQGVPGAGHGDTRALAQANLKRAQEGLRVLEEVFRTEDEGLAGAFEELRYCAYRLERDILSGKRKTPGRGLYLILDAASHRFGEIARAASLADIPAVQLRCKDASDRVFLEKALELRGILSGKPTLFIVNDRVDIALLSGADGVHLGQHDIDPLHARELMGAEAVIGLSTHNAEEVKKAASKSVDYIGFGPVFEPFSKNDHEPLAGVDALCEAVKLSSVPVFAIGGITAQRAAGLRTTGCRGVASIGAVERAEDPLMEIERIHRIFVEGT